MHAWFPLKCVYFSHLLLMCCHLRVFQVTVSTDLPVHLVGFSKGVTVLNQLITELAVCKREGFKSNNRREELLSDISTYHKFFSKVRRLTTHLSTKSRLFMHISLCVLFLAYCRSARFTGWMVGMDPNPELSPPMRKHWRSFMTTGTICCSISSRSQD